MVDIRLNSDAFLLGDAAIFWLTGAAAASPVDKKMRLKKFLIEAISKLLT